MLKSHDTGDWFWRIPENGERPPDLGYFLGYRIAKAFYDRSPSKEKAIAHLIHPSDYEQILDQSEYNP